MNWLKVTALACCLWGCSASDEPTRYHVSGNVTFNGKPIPAGIIYFEPDAMEGNSGPQGYAEIIDGRFNTNTNTGEGIVQGPATVAITGFKQRSAPGENFVGNALFPEYVIHHNFEPKDAVIDFDVPASAAKAQRR